MNEKKNRTISKEALRIASTIFNTGKDAITLLSDNLEIIKANNQFYKLCGSKKLPSRKITDFLLPAQYQTFLSEWMQQNPQAQPIPSFECEFQNHSHEKHYVEIHTRIVSLKKYRLIVCEIHNKTTAKNIPQLLAKTAAHIENRERQKLANDLHDNVGPLLSSMNMYLSILAHKNELQAQNHILDDLKKILKDTIATVREISNNLSPYLLTNHGLTDALDYFIHTKQRLIKFEFRNEIGLTRFDDLIENMIYQIVIESFNNSLKHSGASTIGLDMHLENNTLFLKYRDNGCGFNFDERMKDPSKCMGLLSIINRIRVIDGQYCFDTAVGKGFTLEIECPIKSQEEK